MKRTDAFGSTVDEQFTDGNPVGGVPATVVDSTWLNQIQEELATIVEVGGGDTLDDSLTNQVLTAIQAMIAAAIPAVTIPVGDIVPSYNTTKSGYIPLIGGALGSAASGATYASATYEALYTHLWNQIGNTYAPVAGGRGVSAALDFAANKIMTMPDWRGRAPIGAGTGSGLTNRILGSNGGEEAHTQTVPELVPHTHSYTKTDVFDQIDAGSESERGAAISTQQTGSQGGGVAANVMQPWTAVNWFIKY